MIIPQTKKPARRAYPFPQALTAAPAGKYFLRLYVAGATVRSRQALRRVHLRCEAEMKDNYELEVIDVYQQPELARKSQIVATPTLVKVLPAPAQRFIGDSFHVAELFDDVRAIKAKEGTM